MFFTQHSTNIELIINLLIINIFSYNLVQTHLRASWIQWCSQILDKKIAKHILTILTSKKNHSRLCECNLNFKIWYQSTVFDALSLKKSSWKSDRKQTFYRGDPIWNGSHCIFYSFLLYHSIRSLDSPLSFDM